MSISENIRTTRKAKTILNRLLASRTLSEEGLAWLTVATDPFHDLEVSCSGYPDISTSRSLVQTFTVTTSVSKPAALTTDTWDLHTFFNPCTTPADLVDPVGRSGRFYPTVVNSGGLITGQTSAAPASPNITSFVNAVAVNAGSPLTSVSATPTDKLTPPLSVTGGPYRLIAVGYEVVNTTSDLYKQGAVTCYKSPEGYNATNLIVANGPAGLNSVFTEISSAPPETQAEAALYPNSRTWEAKEGAYVIPPGNDIMRYKLPTIGRSACMQVSRGQANIAPGTLYYPYVDVPTGTSYPAGNDLLPFDVSGAIFTGLSAQTTLQVTARYIFERVPSIREPDLLVLTRVPAPYDPIALEIYSRVIAEMPVACMVKDNPLGEWFADILGAIANMAPLLGSAIGTIVPGAEVVGRAVGSAAAAGQTAFKRAQKQANVPKSPAAKQKQNPPGTGKRAKKKAKAKQQANQM